MSYSFYFSKISGIEEDIFRLKNSKIRESSKVEFLNYYKNALDIYKSIENIKNFKDISEKIKNIYKEIENLLKHIQNL